VILTTCRIVAVNKDTTSLFKSFDIPLGFLIKEEFKQPIFGANYIGGICKPLFNILPGDIKFKIWFMEGGCGTFAPAFLNMVHSMRKNQNRGIDQKMMNVIVSGQFAKTAYIDPNDPSVIFLEQPDIPNQNVNTQNFNAPNQNINPTQNTIPSNQGFNNISQPQSFQGNSMSMNGVSYSNNPTYQNSFTTGSNPSYVNPNSNPNNIPSNTFAPMGNIQSNYNPNPNYNTNLINTNNPSTMNSYSNTNVNPSSGYINPNYNPNPNIVNNIPNNTESNQININSYPSLNDIDIQHNTNNTMYQQQPGQLGQVGQNPQVINPPHNYPNNDIQNMNNVNLNNQQNNPKYFGFWGPELKKNN
jgi:WW domain-binding protein 2